MIIGAVMFCIDIWKWSKRPEKFTNIHEDLSNSSTDTKVVQEKKSIDIDDVF